MLFLHSSTCLMTPDVRFLGLMRTPLGACPRCLLTCFQLLGLRCSQVQGHALSPYQTLTLKVTHGILVTPWWDFNRWSFSIILIHASSLCVQLKARILSETFGASNRTLWETPRADTPRHSLDGFLCPSLRVTEPQCCHYNQQAAFKDQNYSDQPER